MKTKITFKKELPEIPSASGIEIRNSKIFIIGDDSSQLFCLNQDFEVVDTVKIFSNKHEENGRIPKKKKPDFEAMTLMPWGKDEDILIFGSGSKPQREIMIRVDFDNESVRINQYHLSAFYSLLKQKAGLSDDDFNIEAAATWNEKLILLNRGKNNLFLINAKEFREFIKGEKKELKELSVFNFSLPFLKHVEAGFSGACMLEGTNFLIFCASVENTSNWIDDGEIYGSFIGIIDLKNPGNKKPFCSLLQENNTPYLGKIESVAVYEKTSNESLSLLAVTDNDDGVSSLLKIGVEVD